MKIFSQKNYQMKVENNRLPVRTSVTGVISNPQIDDIRNISSAENINLPTA